jgi:hypothetical protein
MKYTLTEHKIEKCLDSHSYIVGMHSYLAICSEKLFKNPRVYNYFYLLALAL